MSLGEVRTCFYFSVCSVIAFSCSFSQAQLCAKSQSAVLNYTSEDETSSIDNYGLILISRLNYLVAFCIGHCMHKRGTNQQHSSTQIRPDVLKSTGGCYQHTNINWFSGRGKTVFVDPQFRFLRSSKKYFYRFGIFYLLCLPNTYSLLYSSSPPLCSIFSSGLQLVSLLKSKFNFQTQACTVESIRDTF